MNQKNCPFTALYAVLSLPQCMWSSAWCWPLQLWGYPGARGRGPVPAAGFRRGVHRRRYAGLLLANLLGSTVIDVVFGTLATLLACLLTYKLRDIRVKGWQFRHPCRLLFLT